MATATATREELLTLLADFVTAKRGLDGGLGSRWTESTWRNLSPGRKRGLVRLVDEFDGNDASERRKVPPYDRLLTYVIRNAEIYSY